MKNLNNLDFKAKLKKIFHNKFTLFAFLQIIVSIGLFITMLTIVSFKVSEAITYLININNNPDEEILGITLLTNSRAIFYLIMFIFQIIYSIYGAAVLFKYNNERQVFKVIYRSIFYVAGLLTFNNIFGLIFFLVLPVTEILSFLVLFFFLSVLYVAIVGRLVANFSFYNVSLKNRKRLGLSALIVLLITCCFYIYSNEAETIIFYGLEILTTIFAILATIFFKDPKALNFETEPKLIPLKPEIILDIPNDLSLISDHLFSKNTKLTKATIPDGIERIGIGAFANCLRIKEVILPKTIKLIDYNAFFNCQALKTIIYEGTILEFNQIEFKNNWLTKVNTNIIHCTDGIISINN